MCGIVGAVSTRNIVPILVQGLQRLEYRGYDSCGVAVHQDGQLRRSRSTSRVAELQALARSENPTPDDVWRLLRAGNRRFVEGTSDHPNQDAGQSAESHPWSDLRATRLFWKL